MSASTTAPEPKPAALFPPPIAVGVVLLNLIVVGAALLSLYESRTQYDERAAATAYNLVEVLEHYIDGVIDRIDVALLAVADEAEGHLQADPIREVRRTIMRQHGRQPGIDGLRIADAKGDFVDGTEAPAQPSIAEQAYFRRLRDDPAAELVFSDPLPGGRAGRGTIVFARRIERPGGGFAGVVYGEVAIDHFYKMFPSIDVGKQGIVALRSTDLGVIARYPPVPVGQQPVSNALKDFMAAGAALGTYTARSPVDGIERIFSFRKVAEHPFVVIVGLAKEDYLEPWRVEVAERLVYILLFAAVSLVWMWLLHRVWVRKAFADRLERQVRERTTQLRALAVELTMVEERERSAIAVDLHDGLGQVLAIAKLKLTSLEAPDKALPDCPYHGELLRQIKEIETMIDESNRSVRSLARQLSPPVLHQLGLVAALEWLADEMYDSYGLKVRVHDDGELKPLDQASRNMLFRAVRELLMNVHKHAGTGSADVSVSSIEAHLMIAVTDSGAGFDAAKGNASSGGGFGLFSVGERIGYFGGEMHIDSGHGDGTVVVLMLPLVNRVEEVKNDTAGAG